MRILLAGAAGFIGSHLAERLVRDGHEVIGLDNLVTGREQNLAPLLAHDGFHFAWADVTLPLAGHVDPIGPLDWVLNLASPASPPKYLALPIETMRTNAEGTRQLLELARTRGASFLLASTSEVYGDPLVHPQAEDYWGNVRPHGPRSVYDEAKRYAEAMTFAYHRTFGLDTRVIRIFNTYGPRMDPWDGRVVTTFIREALAGRAADRLRLGEADAQLPVRGRPRRGHRALPGCPRPRARQPGQPGRVHHARAGIARVAS